MNTFTVETAVPLAEDVRVSANSLSVDLGDGRTIAVPLEWYPRLLNASAGERKNWRLIGKGQGIHWEALDEDVSVAGLLAGRSSGESQASFKKWLVSRGVKHNRRASRHG